MGDHKPWRRYHADLYYVLGDGEYHLSQAQRDALCQGGEASGLHFHLGKDILSVPSIKVERDGSSAISPSGCHDLNVHGYPLAGFHAFRYPGSPLNLEPGAGLGFPYSRFARDTGYSVWVYNDALVASPVLRIKEVQNSTQFTLGQYYNPTADGTLPIDPAYYRNNRPFAWILSPASRTLTKIIDAQTDLITIQDPVLKNEDAGAYVITQPPLNPSGDYPYGLYIATVFVDASGKLRPFALQTVGLYRYVCDELLFYSDYATWVSPRLSILPPAVSAVDLQLRSSFSYAAAGSYRVMNDPSTLISGAAGYRSFARLSDYYIVLSFRSPVLRPSLFVPKLIIYTTGRSYVHLTGLEEV